MTLTLPCIKSTVTTILAGSSGKYGGCCESNLSLKGDDLQKMLVYNGAEVISMSSKVEKLLQELKGFTTEEIKELITKIAEKYELQGWLNVSESAFADWDNEEDSIYDRL